MENRNEKIDRKNDVDIFFDKENMSFSYLYSKCERISSVLYIVSSKIPDSDPLKMSVRSKALELILFFSAENRPDRKIIVSLDSEGNPEREALKKGFRSLVNDIRGLLAITHAAGYLSKMNVVVLVDELSALLRFILGTSESSLFSHESKISGAFFDTNRSLTEGQESVQKEKNAKGSYTREFVSETGSELRKRLIIKIITEKGRVGIKDISSEIRDCSEKTIQRILGVMVDEKILNREGSRRWSVYSIRKDEMADGTESSPGISPETEPF